MADHDQSYKQWFSHAELVRDLLTGFVREEWVAELDSGCTRWSGTLQADYPTFYWIKVDAILAERVKEWTHEWEERGIQKGRVDTETVRMIQSASSTQLLQWSERILTADTLDEMLTKPG